METDCLFETDAAVQLSFDVLPASCLVWNECSVCLMEHDEEIHAATLRLRMRFRGDVTRYLECELRPLD
jgi:hypothetical protein